MEATGPPRLRDNPWIVLVTVCLGFFMILLDTTIVNVAIASMTEDLGASLDEILWVVNAYVLTFAVLLITSGRLGDMYGPKRLFLAGLALFTAASVACGLAEDPGHLIGSRVAQGVGAALLMPQTLSILTQIFPPGRRGAAFGVWSAMAGLAAAAGPTLGGIIVTNWGWEWIFFVNLPIGIASFALAVVVIPDLRLGRQHRLDVTGTVLVTAALFLITFGLIEGEQHEWGQLWGFVTVPAVIGAGVALLVVFLVAQYRAKGEPLVPFTILRERNFSLMLFVAAAMSFGLLGIFVPFLIYLQSVLGLSAMQAGFTVAPMALTSIFISPIAGRLADRVGGKYVLMTGLTLFATGTGTLAWEAQPDSSRWTFLPGLVLAGVGMGFTFPPMTTLAMHRIAPHLAGAASGVLNTTRQMGAVIGGAAVGALFQALLSSELRSSAVAHAAELPPEQRDGFIAAFARAAAHGLQVGRGQTGAVLPAGTPAEVAAATFREAFVAAMRPSLALAVGVLATAALSCLFIEGRRPEPEPLEAAAAQRRAA